MRRGIKTNVVRRIVANRQRAEQERQREEREREAIRSLIQPKKTDGAVQTVHPSIQQNLRY
jgi:hypothetical protein